MRDVEWIRSGAKSVVDGYYMYYPCQGGVHVRISEREDGFYIRTVSYNGEKPKLLAGPFDTIQAAIAAVNLFI